jgi:hypothetical protein
VVYKRIDLIPGSKNIHPNLVHEKSYKSFKQKGA